MNDVLLLRAQLCALRCQRLRHEGEEWNYSVEDSVKERVSGRTKQACSTMLRLKNGTALSPNSIQASVDTTERVAVRLT